MNRAAQQLGRKGKGKPKTMTDAASRKVRSVIGDASEKTK